MLCCDNCKKEIKPEVSRFGGFTISTEWVVFSPVTSKVDKRIYCSKECIIIALGGKL